MALNPRRSPALFSALCGCLFLAIAAPIPIWPFGNECDRPLWTSAEWFYIEIRDFAGGSDGWPVLWAVLRQYQRLPVLSAVALVIGGLGGRLWYYLLWEFDG